MMTAVPPQHPFDRRFWPKVLLVGGLYLLVQVTVLGIAPSGGAKYWVLEPLETRQYWDAGIYAQLAIAPQCTAFYPLWPWLMQTLGHPETPTQALRFATNSSAVMFLGALPLALLTFEKSIQQRSIAFLVFFLYALGPNAIFHTIGYTESLFSVASLGWLCTVATIEERSRLPRFEAIGLYGLWFGLSIMMSLTRPVLVPALGAIAAVWGLLIFRRRASQRKALVSPPALLPRWGRLLRLTGVAGLGYAIGYGIYGHYCQQAVGDFWAPFYAQTAWGRTLGWRPWLLVLPRSLLIDLHGVYLSGLLCIATVWLSWAVSHKRTDLTLYLPRSPWLYGLLVHPLAFIAGVCSLRCWGRAQLRMINIVVAPTWEHYLGRFSGLFAIAFCGAHALINLLANTGNLYSTSRHVFGTPFAFVGIGLLLAVLNLPLLNRVVWGVAIAGVGLLAHQWFAFATDGWLG